MCRLEMDATTFSFTPGGESSGPTFVSAVPTAGSTIGPLLNTVALTFNEAIALVTNPEFNIQSWHHTGNAPCSRFNKKAT